MKILLKYKSILFVLLLMCLLSSCGTSDEDIIKVIQSGEPIKRAFEKYYVDHKEYPESLRDLYPAYINDTLIHRSGVEHYYKGWYITTGGDRFYMSYTTVAHESTINYSSKYNKTWQISSTEQKFFDYKYEIKVINNTIKISKRDTSTGKKIVFQEELSSE